MKKRVFTIILSFILVLTVAAIVNTGDVCQAAKKVKASPKSVTMKVGTKKKVKVTKVKGAKYLWKTKNKKVVKISGSAKKYQVNLKAVKKGTTKVSCQVKIKAKKQTVTVKVKVTPKNTTLVSDAQTPASETPASETPTPGASTPTVKPDPTPTPQATATPAPVGPSDPDVIQDGTTLTLNVPITRSHETGTNGGKLKANSDGTSLITFQWQYGNLALPLGKEDHYNISQYTKIVMNVDSDAQFRVTLFDHNGSNLITKGQEWENWNYVGGDAKDQTIEIDIEGMKLTDVASIVISGNTAATQTITLKSVKLIGSTDNKKEEDEKEEVIIQDPNAEVLTLNDSFKSILENNPLFTQRYSADPTSIVYNGRLYVYSTNDVYEYTGGGALKKNSFGTISKLNVISSADLVNWTDHGTIEVRKGNPGTVTNWANNSYAPSIAMKNIGGKDKFFLYFANGSGGVGVLTSNSPAGPWTDELGHALVDHDTPNCSSDLVPWCFDPSVFVDDDGQAYLYFGGGIPKDSSGNDIKANPKTSRVVKLSDDMIHISGTPQEIDAPYMFEDSEIDKIGDTYYYSYCANWDNPSENGGGAAIVYMTSNNPMTGWKYQGTILKNTSKYFGCGETNHHQITEFNGKRYLLYHTHVLEKRKTKGDGSKGYRSLQMDELTIDADGKIQELTPTLEGVAAIKTINPMESQEAETIGRMSGLDTEMNASASGGNVLCGIDTADWLSVCNADFGTEGASKFEMKLASDTNIGAVDLYIDAPNTTKGKMIGKLKVDNTGDTSTYRTLSTNLDEKVTGVHDIYFVFRGVGYKVDTWKFSK